MQPNIVCIDPKLRNDLQDFLKEAGVSKKQIAMFNDVPECDTGVLEVRLAPEKGKKGKRAPSAYNLFIGTCMKGGKSDLKTCATEWKKRGDHMSDDPQQMTDDLPPTSCIDEASTRLQDLLRVTCEMPLSQLAGLATDHGVRPIDLLTRVEGSGTCFLDYGTGHVRCTPAPVEELRPIKAEAPDDAPI